MDLLGSSWGFSRCLEFVTKRAGSSNWVQEGLGMDEMMRSLDRGFELSTLKMG